MQGFLFTIDSSYQISESLVESFKLEELTDNQLFMSVEQAEENPSGFVRDAHHQLVARLRRKKVVEDLAKLGYLPGCSRPDNSYELVLNCPNVSDEPESVYYEIRLTFKDMDWEYPGHPSSKEV
ncbi:MAG: hypothetical protein ACR2PX_10005 [Endozoicomonas sp.]|uniref:hypothetical protein n=1 Tax=Endozoicomonas sp. TaxID=1892382 RepID=UPI003D9BC208